MHNAETPYTVEMTPPHSSAVDAWSGADPARPLASWYTEGISDGLGDRLLMFDNSGTASLELLRFRPELAATFGFEDALRDRVAELQAFRHPSFPDVRAVQHIDGRLALVSTSATGKRLTEIFRSPRGRAGAHPSFAAWLVRDLTSALADLQRHIEGVAHSALSPDRIVITPDGRLMIVEHVLGGALDCLRLPPNRLWVELGLIAPEGADGAAALDPRTDVMQLGWIVLSALIGRRVTPVDCKQADALVDEFVRTAGPRSPALVAALRSWLERALQLTSEAFESAIDAHDALCELRVHGGPHTIAFPARTTPEALEHEAPRELPAASESPITDPQIADSPPPSQVESTTMTAGTDVIAALRARSRPDDAASGYADARASARAALATIAAAIFAVIAIGEGIALARLTLAGAAVPPPVAGPITLDSPQPGDAVFVNGRQVGVTPLLLTLSPDVRAVRVQAKAAPLPEITPAVATVAPERPADLAAAAALAQAGREKRGGLRLVSPVEVQVLEGEHVLGSTADGPIVTTAGRHDLDFINAAIGFRSRQTVDIKAGQIVRMTITPPDGRVSVNAAPWAQVSIDGNTVGDTPLANLPLSAGEHQITFRHPQLGEQTQKVIVKAGALTRVSATLTR